MLHLGTLEESGLLSCRRRPLSAPLFVCRFRRAGRHPRSECLDPGPQLDLPGPGGAVLPVEMEIAVGDRIGIEQRVGPRLAPRGSPGRPIPPSPKRRSAAMRCPLSREIDRECHPQTRHPRVSDGRHRLLDFAAFCSKAWRFVAKDLPQNAALLNRRRPASRQSLPIT